MAALTTWWALLGLAGVVMLGVAVRAVLGGASGRALIKVLAMTGMAELVLAVGLAVGWVVG
jgi:1,4-dihydroxy-2-naphthoate octaprenyltransferase